jgi:hypothetical protein
MGKKGLNIATVALLAILSVALVYATSASIQVTENVSSSGSITVAANLALYSDSACQNALTAINFPSTLPGNSAPVTVYIKNTSSGLSLALSMLTSNWAPSSANGPISVTWNKEGTRLYPGQSIPATLTLTVSSTIVDVSSFNVQITITGTN